MGEEKEKVGLVLVDDSSTLLVKKILFEAVEKKASDVLIEPFSNHLQVRHKIDGVFYIAHSFPLNFHLKIVNCLKVIANLDIAEHRLPQEGRFKLKKLTTQDVDIRISIIPSGLGEKIALRVLDKSRVKLDLDKLGFDDYSRELLKRNLKRSFGIILVCGRAGSGKTTTLYSALRFVDTIEKNIITVEDPIEYELYGINQVAVNEKMGLTFSRILRSILRQDPDIILVGEMRDYDTVEIALRASLTGHLVLSTLHATRSSAALLRLKDMGAPPFLISSSILLVCTQELVRLLCPFCKQAYSPSPQIWELFRAEGIEVNEKLPLYREKGCQQCLNTGFKGRKAVMEALEVTPLIRTNINYNISQQEIEKLALQQGMRSLKVNALRDAMEGIIPLEEVFRIQE